MSEIEKNEPTIGSRIIGIFNKTEEAVKLKVDHVMSAFRKTITDLETVIKEHTEDSVAHAKAIEEHAVAKLEAESEAARAVGIVEKLKAIVN